MTKYYEEQKDTAAAYTDAFFPARLDKWLAYFARQIEANDGFLFNGQLSYVDLFLFQLIEGIRFAFPKRSLPILNKYENVVALVEEVRKQLKHYLDSDRRQPFNNKGIFRFYPELDEIKH